MKQFNNTEAELLSKLKRLPSPKLDNNTKERVLNSLITVERKHVRRNMFMKPIKLVGRLVSCLAVLLGLFLIFQEGIGSSPSTVSKSEFNGTVYIYQTHNHESFVSENLYKKSAVQSKERNIELVGERLVNSLRDNNMNVIHNKEDYMGQMVVYAKLYEQSRKPLQEALNKDKNIKMVFDIHRDSRKRQDTTVKINGKEVANVYFVVSKKNPDWKANEGFANKIHKKMEQMYPGVSEGVLVKEEGNELAYNQDLHPNSLIIEMGGVENTLEEEYRTADMLANVIAEVAKEQEMTQ
ncbi:stage II sporulation protein P [Ammoniphilus sp. 3BR4]|uniref:stage II sporulation protein P n=1 Tax=Ammoniphilus sp. 3BR4 TaxID=3158265 RepID=UPI0034668099